jgi:hypothetical protein
VSISQVTAMHWPVISDAAMFNFRRIPCKTYRLIGRQEWTFKLSLESTLTPFYNFDGIVT